VRGEGRGLLIMIKMIGRIGTEDGIDDFLWEDGRTKFPNFPD
jgi:hypothetical protein